MDVKPGLGMKGVKGEQSEYPHPTQDYLPTTSSQQWHYSQHQMALPSHPYLGHELTRGYPLNGTTGRDVTQEEFREGEEGGEAMEAMKGREEIGHYDSGDMISQTGPIRGYPSRADAFVWRPY